MTIFEWFTYHDCNILVMLFFLKTETIFYLCTLMYIILLLIPFIIEK